VTPPDDSQNTPPDDNKPTPPPDDNKPTGGEGTKFVNPISSKSITESFNVIYASKTTGFIYRHKAVDFGADEGTEVYSMADGVVLEVSMNEKTGNYITIQHSDGLVTLYRFVEPVTGIHKGATVNKGEVIAKVAAAYGSEAKDGTHLHLEVFLNGAPADPANYIDIVNDEK
ncbi:MAG: M23 family metallopeptidase, partial [Clostridiales bacterium]|nr:M23 family metallopeptidase [Clostridiales bacterium]